ncbi:MAG: hypothetical protein AAF152_19225 [Cyanobacteria bacterium P01_A01_bin.114]
MPLPTVLRYLPARLRPLQNPVVWMPALALGLVGVFAWEYKNHPEWLQWGGVDTDAAVETGLTPEEQAGIAEIDTLDVLINEANSNSPAVTDPGADLDAGSENGDAETDSSLLSATDPQIEALTPFADYLAQYQLPGTVRSEPGGSANAPSQPGAIDQGPRAANGNAAPDNSLFLLSQPAPVVRESALSRALSDRAASAAQQPTETPEANQSRPPSRQASVDAPAESAPSENLPFDQTGITPGQLSGNPNAGFIRTTPAMSPPPGTTGYQVPSSINLSTYDRTLNRTGQFTPGVPSTSSPAPSFEIRQPQRPGSVLPGQVNTGIAQPQNTTPGAFGGSSTPEPQPSNTFDSFFD